MRSFLSIRQHCLATANRSLSDDTTTAMTTAQEKAEPDEHRTPSVKVALGCGAMFAIAPIVFFGIFLLPKVLERGDSVAITMVVIAMFGGAALFGSFFTAAAYFLQTIQQPRPLSLVDEYRAFAESVHGEATIEEFGFGISVPRAVRFEHRGLPVSIELPEAHEGRDGKSYTRITYSFPHAASLRCYIQPKGLLSFLGTRGKDPEIQLGWNVFDDQFVVQSNDPLQTERLFDRSIQEALLRFQDFANQHVPRKYIGPGYFDVAIENESFQLRMHSLLEFRTELEAFYQETAKLYELVAQTV